MNWKDYCLKNWDKFRIEKSIKMDSITIIILKLKSINEKEIPKEGVNNLLAINNKDESIKWVADLPINFDGYKSFDNIRFQNNQLEAWCGSIYCIIDLNNGKIVSEEFVK